MPAQDWQQTRYVLGLTKMVAFVHRIRRRGSMKQSNAGILTSCSSERDLQIILPLTSKTLFLSWVAKYAFS
jgi:hypothetical protein